MYINQLKGSAYNYVIPIIFLVDKQIGVPSLYTPSVSKILNLAS